MDFISTLKKLLAKPAYSVEDVVALGKSPVGKALVSAQKKVESIGNTIPMVGNALKQGSTFLTSKKPMLSPQGLQEYGKAVLSAVPPAISAPLAAYTSPATFIGSSAIGAGANTVFNKLAGDKRSIQDLLKEGAVRGLAEAPIMSAVTGVTNPIIGKTASKVTDMLKNPVARKLAQGTVKGALSIPQGAAIAGATGYKYDPTSAAIDFAVGSGAAGAVGKKISNILQDKIGFQAKAIKPIMDAEGAKQEALPFTTEQVPSGTKPENMFESKFSQTGVKKGAISEATKQVLQNEPQMATRLNLGEQAQKVASTPVNENMVKIFTGDTFKFDDISDIDTVNSAIATIKHLDVNNRPNEAATIWNKLSTSKTQAGQFLNMGKLLLEMTPSGKVATVKKVIEDYVSKHTGRMDKLLGNKLSKFQWSPEFEKELKDLAVAVENTKGTPEADIAMKAFMEKAFGGIPPGVNDYVTAIRYNGLLSSPISFSKNAWSNLLQTGVFRPLDILTSEGIPQAVKYEAGMLNAFKEAKQAFKTAWKSGDPLAKEFGELDSGTMKDYLRSAVSKKTRNIATLWGVPTRALEAADKFFGALIQGGELAKGSTPEAAKATAEKYLFREMFDPHNLTKQGVLGQSIDAIGSGINEMGNKVPTVRWFIPFLKTVLNVSKEMLERSPAGYVNMIGNENKKLAIAKATTGTAAMLATYFMLDDKNFETDAPKDPEEASAWYASGRKAWSVKLGDKYVPIQYLGTFSFPLALAMIAKDKTSKDPNSIVKGFDDKIKDAVIASSSYWLKSTPIQGVNDLFEALSNPDSNVVASIVSNLAKQPIPASGLMRWITQIQDNVYRKVDKGSFGQSVLQRIERDLPLLSQGLDPYTDPAGNPSMRDRLQTGFALPYQVGTQNPNFEPMVQENIRNDQVNAEVKKNEQMQEQLMNSPQEQKMAEMTTIQGILAKKKQEEEKNKIIKSVINLPPALQVQAFKNYQITQDDVKNFELKQIKALNTAETADYIMAQKSNDFTKLYEQEVLTPSVAKMLEKKGYIQDATTLMENVKKTDVYEQKQVMKKATKSYINKLASLQKRTIKSMLSKKAKVFKAPKTKAYKPKKFKAYKAPKMKFPKIKTKRR